MVIAANDNKEREKLRILYIALDLRKWYFRGGNRYNQKTKGSLSFVFSPSIIFTKTMKQYEGLIVIA